MNKISLSAFELAQRAVTFDLLFGITFHRNHESFPFDGYSSTLVLGKMALQFVSMKPKAIVIEGFPNDEWLTRTVQIWPFKKECSGLNWPPPQPITDQSLVTFLGRWGGLRLS